MDRQADETMLVARLLRYLCAVGWKCS